ncbi:hypothetical protein CFOL_v3_31210 [Cephalotus follicularis]|uniref:Survival Motor Neuron Gemin2-binding domain-containing protein n=1 Tax=Cephalotus follicularis TaxID=3775 RepID=A0A1Q3D5S7_CEPFO|nr:hypothetical protein CFOL_v3_31210 [Cephalotus follicularis]
MGKEGDLWDDSALFKAFDQAISKYKKLHGKKIHDNLPDEGKPTSSNGEDVSNVTGEPHQPIRHLETEGNSNVASNAETEMGDAKVLAPVKENHILNSHELEPYADLSCGLLKQDAHQGYSYSQGAEDHNQLLSEYYVLEEKRQKLLQQLHQVGSSNYQYAGENSSTGAQWGTFSTSQGHPVPASQASHPTVCYPFCPYVCQCTVAPCTSFPACSSGGPCVGQTCTDTNTATSPGNSPSLVDGDIVKTAMGAANRAISSMNSEILVNSTIHEEKEQKTDVEGEIAQGVSSETDLTVVLNAWYSAGLYTGKYLTEQSIARKRHS